MLFKFSAVHDFNFLHGSTIQCISTLEYFSYNGSTIKHDVNTILLSFIMSFFQYIILFLLHILLILEAILGCYCLLAHLVYVIMDIVVREISNTPPVTTVYIALCVLITIAVQFNVLSPFQLYFNPSLIVKNFQIWRIVTCYCFFGTFNFNFLFNILFAYRYCRMLEETWYSNKTADFVMMFVFCATITCIIASFLTMLFLSHVLTMMLVYVWSRRNPFIRLNIFGILDINAPYLPWVFFAFSFLLGNNMTVDLIGIIVGHLYYFLEDVYPNQTNGFRIIRAPGFLKYLCNRRRNHNTEYEPIPEAQQPGGFDWNER